MTESSTRWRGQPRRSALVWALTALLVGMMLFISEAAYHGAAGQLRTLVTMGRARLEMFAVLRSVTDAESGQRGYLITGRAEYLLPYQRARQTLPERLQQLQQLLSELGDAPGEQLRQGLDKATQAKLSELAEVLRLHEAGQATQARELLLSGIGRDQMEAVRDQVNTLVQAQNQQIDTLRDNVFETLLLNRIGIASMTTISLAILVLFWRQGRQLAAHRAQQQAQLRAERDRLETEVMHRTAELTELTRHLQTAREDERARIARDLHDELGALLTSAKLDVARIRPSLQQSAPELLPRLAHLTEALNGGIALKRRIIEDLRPSTLDHLGLLPALEVLCTEAAERMGLPIVLQASPVRLSHSAELTAFRVVQEALTNTAKHGQAQQVTVRLQPEGGWAVLQVQDDGRGFDTALRLRGTHGLLGMRFRVEAEQGQLQVQSQPGGGTTLTARLPQAAEPAEPPESPESPTAPAPSAL